TFRPFFFPLRFARSFGLINQFDLLRRQLQFVYERLFQRTIAGDPKACVLDRMAHATMTTLAVVMVPALMFGLGALFGLRGRLGLVSARVRGHRSASQRKRRSQGD